MLEVPRRSVGTVDAAVDEIVTLASARAKTEMAANIKTLVQVLNSAYPVASEFVTLSNAGRYAEQIARGKRLKKAKREAKAPVIKLLSAFLENRETYREIDGLEPSTVRPETLDALIGVLNFCCESDDPKDRARKPPGGPVMHAELINFAVALHVEARRAGGSLGYDSHVRPGSGLEWEEPSRLEQAIELLRPFVPPGILPAAPLPERAMRRAVSIANGGAAAFNEWTQAEASSKPVAYSLARRMLRAAKLLP